MKFCLFLPVLITVSCAFLINPYPKYRAYHDGGDPGQPLLLTPYIKNGTEEAIKSGKDAAKVPGDQFLNVESYSGYLTVNEAHNSNMFFWYFTPEGNVSDAPVLLWLQGGPGASSLFGLFTENGPFSVSNGKLIPRKYSWTKNHHVIYIDNPVGTGFSFTDEDAGYVKNEKEVGRDLYEAISQLFTLFKNLQELDFWITGESYAGKYVPALAFTIHNQKMKMAELGLPEKVPINLKGIAMGNGLSDPLHQLHYGDYLYQIGLIDYNGRELFHKYEQKGVDCIKKRDMNCAFDAFDQLINMDQYPDGSVFYNLTGFKTYFNYIQGDTADTDQSMAEFLQSSETRKAIHVGNSTFHDLDGAENKVELHLKQDIMDSVAPWIAQLLDNYRVCVYNGQLDIIVAYPLTESYLQQLKFKDANEYHTAERRIWRVDNEIAGYVKEAGNLVELLVRNAGHMAPADQPKWIFDLISRLTSGKKFY